MEDVEAVRKKVIDDADFIVLGLGAVCFSESLAIYRLPHKAGYLIRTSDGRMTNGKWLAPE